MSSNVVLEHRSTPTGRRLARNRMRVALAVAAVEGALVLVGAVSWWLVALLALGAVSFYWVVGRDHARADVRTVAWIGAVSQLTVVLVPIAAATAVVVAGLLVVLLAVGALVVLLLDRR